MRIAVFGLGRMGTPIAQRLVEAGYPVSLYLRSEGRALPPALSGAKATHSLAEAVDGAQIALSVVTGDEAEEDLTFGPGGLLQSLGPGAIHLCMTSVSPRMSLRLAEAHQESGQGYVAAPILGSPRAMANRQAWFIVAGPDVHVVRCLGLLEDLGRGVTRVGTRADLAHALKLGAQGLSLAVIGALAETLAFGEKAGYAPASYLRLLNLGQFKSPQADAWGALMVRHDHEATDQTVDSAITDLDLLRLATGELGLAMPLADHLRGQLAGAQDAGLGALDVTALSMLCRRQAGLPGPWDSQAPVPAPAVAAPRPTPRSGKGRSTSARSAGNPGNHQVPAAATPGPASAAPPPPGPGAPPAPVAAPPLAEPSPAPAPAPPIPEPSPAPAPAEPPAIIPPEPAAAPAPPPAPEAVPEPPKAWTLRTAWTWSSHIHLPGTRSFAPAAPAPARTPEPPAPPPAPARAPEPPGPPPAIPRTPDPEPAPAAGAPAPSPAASPSAPASLPGPFTPADQTIYYEEQGGAVWAYRDGQHHPTPWRRLADAEFGVTEVTLVRVSRYRSLNPHAVQEFEPLFGGRSRIQLTDGQVLTLGWEATRKLKFILGL